MPDNQNPKKPEHKYGFSSPHNFAPAVRAQMHLPDRVRLNDLTLREGRGLDGVYLEPKDIELIARGLAEIGVPMVQLAYSPGELKHFAGLKLAIKAEVLISSPYQRPPYTLASHREKIDFVTGLGFAADLCFGTSDHLLLGRQDIQGGNQSAAELRKRELEAAVGAVQYGKAKGGTIHTNLQDFLRADLDFVLQLCRELANAGIDLITLDDFAGPAIPAVYKYAVEQVKKVVPQVPLGIHVTNDFGLGTAVVLGAFEGGAEVLDVGINNYGERTGHADLAEIAVALEVFYGISTGIKLDKLFGLSQLAAEAFRVPVPSFKPLVGDKAFADVGDVHYSYRNHPWIYRVIPESLVGNRRVIAFGDKSGPNAVKAKAAVLGIKVEEEKVNKIVEGLLAKLREVRRPITDDEFRAITDAAAS
jgi:isopropylmalate/homocitrate/citramalate synthase